MANPRSGYRSPSISLHVETPSAFSLSSSSNESIPSNDSYIASSPLSPSYNPSDHLLPGDSFLSSPVSTVDVEHQVEEPVKLTLARIFEKKSAHRKVYLRRRCGPFDLSDRLTKERDSPPKSKLVCCKRTAFCYFKCEKWMIWSFVVLTLLLAAILL